MSDDCLKYCLLCKDIGQFFIDEEETHRVCNLHKHSEIRNFSVTCRMCNSDANSIKGDGFKGNSVSKEIKIDFCDQLCFKCNRLGGFYVNYSQYHTLCDLHTHEDVLDNVLVDCNHCHNNVLLIYDVLSKHTMKKTIILFKFRNLISKTINFSRSNNDKNKSTNDIVKSGTSSKNSGLNSESSAIGPAKTSRSANLNKNLSESTFVSRVNINPQINKLQVENLNNAMRSSSVSKKIESNLLPAKIMDDSDSDIDIPSPEEAKIGLVHKTIQSISHTKDIKSEVQCLPNPIENIFCYNHKNTPGVKKEYYFHFNLRSVSPNPMSFKNKNDMIPSKKLQQNMIPRRFPVRSERSICIDCYEWAKLKVSDKIKYCPNCKESIISDEIKFNCSHDGCGFCYFEGNCCFKCWEKEHISKDYECFKCKRIRDSVQLFCGHFICKKCRRKKRIKRLNYSCIECCMSKMKKCLSCNKICEWEINEENGLLHKKCCDNYYCLFCFDRKIKVFNIYKECNCLKEKSIFNRIKQISDFK
ncbi:hypothetical protein SteCoe_8116 [Stentor coeruleus]|uniref:RING-type domain-containing protein n=1 Tax=Stentor coeruleus TaxID=5963 RepID=A0A1R2CL19_9CILI|nr:hypothetical protein SteCoe_8116 [Stentor coeruleus]